MHSQMASQVLPRTDVQIASGAFAPTAQRNFPPRRESFPPPKTGVSIPVYNPHNLTSLEDFALVPLNLLQKLNPNALGFGKHTRKGADLGAPGPSTNLPSNTPRDRLLRFHDERRRVRLEKRGRGIGRQALRERHEQAAINAARRQAGSYVDGAGIKQEFPPPSPPLHAYEPVTVKQEDCTTPTITSEDQRQPRAYSNTRFSPAPEGCQPAPMIPLEDRQQSRVHPRTRFSPALETCQPTPTIPPEEQQESRVYPRTRFYPAPESCQPEPESTFRYTPLRFAADEIFEPAEKSQGSSSGQEPNTPKIPFQREMSASPESIAGPENRESTTLMDVEVKEENSDSGIDMAEVEVGDKAPVSVKRGRGRPKGSKNRSDPGTENAEGEAGNKDTVPVKRGRGRPKGSKNKPKVGDINRLATWQKWGLEISVNA